MTIGSIGPGLERAIRVTMSEAVRDQLVVIDNTAKTATFHMDNPLEAWQDVMKDFRPTVEVRRKEMLLVLRKLRDETERTL